MARRKAFTLIEVLTVIVIIGILVSISVISWSAIAAKSRDNTRKTDLARIANVLEQYLLSNRSYPGFDIPPDTDYRIYAASWQLADMGRSGCPHNSNNRLAPKYLTSIPKDPFDAFKYDEANCATVAINQANRYLYISAPTNEESGPSIFGSAYALLATLERPTIEDILGEDKNPLKSAVAPFGGWYSLVNNYGRNPDGLGVNANYMIVGGNLRQITE